MPINRFEVLELRRLLAAVSWDGGGDGINFTDALNWSTDALPTAADDVTVDPPGIVSLRLAGSAINMRSLVLREPLRVEAGGTLIVATTAQSDLSIELDGGALQGGAWTFGFAGAILVGTNPSSRIQVVQSIAGDVLMSLPGAYLNVSGDLALSGTVRLGGAGARLVFVGFNTLASGTIRFESTAGNAPSVGPVNGTLTLGSGVVVNAAPGGRGSIEAAVSRATIRADDGASLSVGASTFHNEGAIIAATGGVVTVLADTEFVNDAGATLSVGGGSTIAIQGTDSGALHLNQRHWRNLGTITVSDGQLYLGGTFRGANLGTVQRSGGVIHLNGVFDNTGQTFTLPPGLAPWQWDNGRVVGGTVNMSLADDGSSTGNRLVGPIVFNGNITSKNLTVEGGADLNGSAMIRNELVLEGSQTIVGGTWLFENPVSGFPSDHPALHIVGNATVTLGADVTVDAGYVNLGLRTGGSGAGTLINEGVIELRPTVQTSLDSVINPGNAFINVGTLRVNDGADAMVKPAGTGFLNQGLVQVGAADNQTRLAIQGLFNNTGALDVNALVQLSPVSAGLFASIADQTATGYHGGAWDGPGIRSSRAAASTANNDAVGYDVVNAIPPYIRLRYTRVGDADADGAVTLADFNLLAGGFGITSDARWNQGDFNYDGRVNLSDFNLLAANFGSSIFAPGLTPTTSLFGRDSEYRRGTAADVLT